VHARGDTAILIMIERQHARIADLPDLPDRDLSMRVTSVHRRTASGWELVHREADPSSDHCRWRSGIPSPTSRRKPRGPRTGVMVLGASASMRGHRITTRRSFGTGQADSGPGSDVGHH
jgi:hypothetical protein